MCEHTCETCKFFSPIHNGIIGTCDVAWHWGNDTVNFTSTCDQWQDEDGNTILGEDW